MDSFTFMVNQLMIGVQSRPTPQAQSIAERIVAEYLLSGYDISTSVVHRAVDQMAVDYAAV